MSAEATPRHDTPGGGCDCSPHYSGACIPIRADVDCLEITARNFRVVDVDVYGLYADGDGIACETRSP